MSISIDKYFRIWDFLKSNPYLVTKTNLKDNATKYNDAETLYRKSLVLSENTLSYPRDVNVINTALQARDKTWKYFAKVLSPGSYAFNTPDMDLYKTMIIDWSASSRTFKDLFLKSTNANSLDTDDVDKAIRGFGVDFVNKVSLENVYQRQLFLLAMCDLYKIKGTPDSITSALTFTGLTNTILREYWIERNPDYYKKLQVRGIAIGKNKQIFNDTTKQYEFLNDDSKFKDTVLSYDAFSDRLFDIAEPHWWYTSDEIIALDYAEENKLKLPSLTPYFGIDYFPDIKKYTIKMAILERILSDQLNALITGNQDLVPTDIGINSDDTNERNKRDLWISDYTEPLSLLECYLAFMYSQIRYDEYVQYVDIYNYLVARGVSVTDSYSYPNAVAELIYWAYQNKNHKIDTVITIDMIIKNYKPSKTNYYCSTNQLIKWWVERPLEFGETVAHTSDNVPEIFFSLDYNFRYFIHPQDISQDQILLYNGLRQLDFKLDTFEYTEAVSDGTSLLDSNNTRLSYDPRYRSVSSNNDNNISRNTINNAQKEYINTFYDYISDPSSSYLDTVLHDGSAITPLYLEKYPRSKIENWAIDSEYVYRCYEYNKWIRNQVEVTWDSTGALVSPTQGKSFTIYDTQTTATIGSQYFYNNHVYKYVTNNTWIRFSVESVWDTNTAPISNAGDVKINTKLAGLLTKASIPALIANKYINGESITQSFIMVIDPLNTAVSKNINVSDLTNFLRINNCIVNRSGYILKNSEIIYEDSYLYTRIVNYSNSYLDYTWVRNSVEVDWSTNGTKMYVGEYKFPNLDLTNRYDAERLLRGTLYKTSTELQADTSTFEDGDQRLVCIGSSGYPEMWIYNSGNWTKNPVNTINDINLGINNNLINWIDGSVKDESEYQKYADKFLNALSYYVKQQFRDPDFDVAGIFKNIQNSGLIKDMINFFKPKRARLLYFSMTLDIDDRLFNSIKIDDDLVMTNIEDSQHDPYHKKTCCDYYDIGCNHDGPTNPQVVVYSNGWLPGQYSSYNTKLLVFDENTNHSAIGGFITNIDAINQLKYLDGIAKSLRNPGNTYCNECDTTTYEPEDAIFEIPDEWKRCGVFHTSVLGSGFSNAAINVVWTAGELVSAINVNDFPIGYIDPDGNEMVHVYVKETGKYHWEIRQKNNSWNPTTFPSLDYNSLTVLSTIPNLDSGVYVSTNGWTWVSPASPNSYIQVSHRHDDMVWPERILDNNGDPIPQSFDKFYNEYGNLVPSAQTQVTEIPTADPNILIVTGSWNGIVDGTYTNTTGLNFGESNWIGGTGELYWDDGISMWVLDNSGLWTFTAGSILGPWSAIGFPVTEPTTVYGVMMAELTLSWDTNAELPCITNTRIDIHETTEFTTDEILNGLTDRSKMLNGVYTDVVNETWENSDGLMGLTANAPVSEESRCGKILPYKETYGGTLEYETGWACYVRIGDAIKVHVYDIAKNINGDYIKIIDSSGNQNRIIPSTYRAIVIADPDLSELNESQLYELKQYMEPQLINPSNIWTVDAKFYYTRIEERFVNTTQEELLTK